jgi:putative mRNA 3-end processing factor
MPALLEATANGLYCPAAGVFIDPKKAVPRAIITHGHSDHARPGHRWALTSASGAPLVRARIGQKTPLESLPFGETRRIGDAWISLHPAGHLLGSAQVRIEVGGRVAVVTGDYKRGADPTCEPFEPVPCHLLVTETTFGLPLYRWPSSESIRDEIDAWWAENQARGLGSVILAYSLGKAQRVLAMLDRRRGPILCHGAVRPFIRPYLDAGIDLPDAPHVNAGQLRAHQGRMMVIAPPGAMNTTWMRRLGPVKIAMASGWMLLRGKRRRPGVDRGFVLSDHVDWPELLQTVADCQPEELWAAHGYREEVARYFREKGLQTRAV